MKRSERFASYISVVAVAGALQAPLLSNALAAPAKAPAKAAKPAPATPARSTPAQPAAPDQPDAPTGAVAAEVNNEKVMMSDVDRILNSMKAREPALAANTAEAKETLATLRQTILDNLITHRLLYQEAKARNISPTAKEVEDALIDFKNSLGSETQFNQAMAREGKSPQDVKRMITEEIAIRKLTEQLTADVKVTDDDLQKFYDQNTAYFVEPEKVRARHILIAVKPGTSPTEREKLRNKAKELLAKALRGADFAKLAFDNSEDPATREDGGDSDFFTREEMVKPFADAAFSTEKGKVYRQVVETKFGFHIIKVEDKKAARTMTLVELKSVLHPLVLKSKIQDKIDQQIDVLRAQATIKKNI